MSDTRRRPQAIIFDYGNVLRLPADQKAFDAALDRLAEEYAFEDGRHLWNHIYVSDAWERAKRGHITEEEMWVERLAVLGIEGAEAIAAFRERLYQHAPDIHPAMRQLLHALRPHFRLAVLSNIAARDMGRWLVDEHRLAGMFEVVVGSADVGLVKPDPAIYLLMLERLDLPPEATLFIDDLTRNTKAAEALGIPSIHFTSPEALRVELDARGLL